MCWVEAAQTGTVLSWRVGHQLLKKKKKESMTKSKGSLVSHNKHPAEGKNMSCKSFVQPDFFIRSRLMLRLSTGRWRTEPFVAVNFYWFAGEFTGETLDLGGKKSFYPRVAFWNGLCWKEITFIFEDIKYLFLGGGQGGWLSWAQFLVVLIICSQVWNHTHTHTKGSTLWPPKLVIFNRYLELFFCPVC